MDYSGMTVTEMISERDKLNGLIKTGRENDRANAKAEAGVRENFARENVSENSNVTFLFKKGEVEGKALRTSEKSVTVEFELEGETVTRYRKYSEIVAVEGERYNA